MNRSIIKNVIKIFDKNKNLIDNNKRKNKQKKTKILRRKKVKCLYLIK